jgi:hypothetical protein
MIRIKNIRIFSIVILGFFYYWLFLESNVNNQFHDKIALSMFIHWFAFYLSLNYFNYVKIPFVTVLSFLNIFGFAIAPSQVEFHNFQLGDFNHKVFNDINLGFVIFYFSHFIFLSHQISKNQISEIKSDTSKSNLVYKQLKQLQNFSIAFYILSKLIVLPISGLNEFVELITIGSLLIGFFHGINNWIKNSIMILIIGYTVIQILVSSLIYPLIFLSIYIGAIIFLYGLKTFVSKIVIGLSILSLIGFSFLFNPVKMEYRFMDFSGKSNSYKLIAIKDLIVKDIVNPNFKDDTEDKKSTFWRLTYPMSAISMVQRDTPSKVPYWNGESYINLIYKFIPRIIWKEKPSEEMGQLFGHRYQILNVWDSSTSMNTPILAEAYMNFGYIGFYGIFIFMSYIMARTFITSNIKTKSNKNDLKEMLGGLNISIILCFVVQWESNFSMIFGKIIILFLVNILIEWLAFRKQDSQDKLLHLNLMN